ncbi:glycosyltransferase [Gillisia sp. Q332]|uniref:glycosyltransferase n=1 Tax=Gillisia xinjiangensis TaxID=3384765 RepID=UPI00391A70F2
MKILMVSMFSNHFFNWTEQLKGSGYDIYWLDVFDSNTYVNKINFVHQIIGWRNKLDYPGRYWIKNHLPGLNRIINRFNQRKLEEMVDRKIQEIRPDVVQSFVLFSAAYPIIPVMEKYPEIKWIYSAWGNDLYYMQQIPEELNKIKDSLPLFDYMFADCKRDRELGAELGFKGKYLGTFPGGGGYESAKWKDSMIAFEDRKIILIKGYEGMLGRASYVIEAISKMQDSLKSYEIIIFGCSTELKPHLEEKGIIRWDNVKVLEQISHTEVMKAMGSAFLYIGNCISDGMPNTLLEAIVMGAFPIQSNPGGASAEIIDHGVNGFLIDNPENSQEIQSLIQRALRDCLFMKSATAYNFEHILPKLEREYITGQVLAKYCQVELELDK